MSALEASVRPLSDRAQRHPSHGRENLEETLSGADRGRAPSGSSKVEEIVHVDATSVDFGDPAVQLVAVPGTGERELALVVETPTGRRWS